MKAEIVTITKEKAREILKRNTKNRKVNKKTLEFYKKEMLKGEWKQNGESIIIDINGIVKDGQHRLLAVEETGVNITVPLITGIQPDVMDTIDTGRNRSAADVLELNNFKYSSLLASLSKAVIKSSLYSNGMHDMHVSNSDILKFATENKNHLVEICTNTYTVSSLQVEKVLTPTVIAYYLYTFGNNDDTIYFLKCITGTIRKPQTATDYVYKKLYLCKRGDERLSMNQKQEYIERAYEKYKEGNPNISFIKLSKNK